MRTPSEASHAELRPRPLPRVICLAVAASLSIVSGCGPADEPSTGEVESQDQALDPAVTAFVLDKLKGIGEEIARGLINDILNSDKVDPIAQQLQAMDQTLKTIEKGVVDLTHITRQQETSGVARDIARDRAHFVLAPLFQVRTSPQQAPGYETGALAAAFTYEADSFYQFSGPTADTPYRFDHRLAVPTFIEAVDTWLIMRGLSRKGMDDPSRKELREFADTLDRRASSIQLNVFCERIERQRWKKVNGYMTEDGCQHTWRCTDNIIEQLTFPRPSEKRYTNCENRSYRLHPESAEHAKKYGPEELRSIAQTWRDLANR